MDQGESLSVAEAAAEVGTEDLMPCHGIVDKTEAGQRASPQAASAQCGEHEDQSQTGGPPHDRDREGRSVEARHAACPPGTRQAAPAEAIGQTGLFPTLRAGTRQFPGSTFLDALELVVRGTGLSLPGQGTTSTSVPQPAARRLPTRRLPAVSATDSAERPAPLPWLPEAAEAAVAAYLRPQTLEAAKARGVVARWGLCSVAERLRFGVVDERVALALPPAARETLFGRLVLPTLDEQGLALWMRGRYVSLRPAATLQAQGIPAYTRLPGVAPVPYNYTSLAQAGEDGVVIVTRDEIDVASVLVALDRTGQAVVPVISLSPDNLPRDWAALLARTEALVVLAMDATGRDAEHALRLTRALKTAGCRVAPSFALPKGCHSLNEVLCTLGAASLAMALCEHLEEVTHTVSKAQGWRRWACRIA